MSRTHWTVAVASLLVACLSLPGEPAKAPPGGGKALPPYFKKLGLTREQQKQAQQIRADYHPKIEELRRQIEALQKEERAKLEDLLTDEQRARLKELREGDSGVFSVSGPKSVSVKAGESAELGLKVTRKDFKGKPGLTFKGLPKGLKAEPAEVAHQPDDPPEVKVKLVADEDAPKGEHQVTVRATPDEGTPTELRLKVRVG